ncbi:MAG: DUF1566 domain-containing protein [Candidatus Electrothrix sp. AW3_4]|nr:DUF1566 domain-containing protein [Candidatus Electrothrix gigas]
MIFKLKLAGFLRGLYKQKKYRTRDDEVAPGWSKVVNRMNWNKARRYCNNYIASGHSNWRLPALEELKMVKRKKGALGITDQEVWAEKNGKPAYLDFETGDTNSDVKPDRLRHVLCTAN